MESLNPMFQDKKLHEVISTNEPAIRPLNQKRRTRSDKRHNIKFPVTTVMQMKLRTYSKQMGGIYYIQHGRALSQTVFNTSILQYGLHHPEITDWTLHYQDTKTYMHTMLKEQEYQQIGGPYGLAIQKQLSERKTVFFIIASVLLWIEKGGFIGEILQ